MDTGGANQRGGPSRRPIQPSIGDREDPRPFPCPYCPRKFSSLKAVGGHQSAHKREGRLAAIAKGVFSSHQQVNMAMAAAPAPPLFTRPLLPERAVLPLRSPVPKKDKEKKVSGEPKKKRRCLCGMYLPVGSDSFSDHETAEEKEEDRNDGDGDDSDCCSTANTADLSNLDLELRI